MKQREFRSDTLTMPTKAMREAMCNAEVGDDVYGEDPTVNLLEDMVAKKLGKEAGLFVPSGTAGNQCAIGSHVQPGDEILALEYSHIVQHETGASGAIWGAQLRAVVPKNTPYLTVEDLAPRLRTKDNVHEPSTALIALENALSDGSVMPIEEMSRVRDLARKNGVKVHLDGARIFNAALAMKVDAKEIAAMADSAMICLSKGLGAPVGSVLIGESEFIKVARRKRKMLGGGMRQAGVLAAPGIIALQEGIKRLPNDHANARLLADLLSEIPIFKVNLKAVQTNMVFFTINSKSKNDTDFVEYMGARGFNLNEPDNMGIRVVTSYEVDKSDILAFADAAKEFAGT